jgi:hypothetical protein
VKFSDKSLSAFFCPFIGQKNQVAWAVGIALQSPEYFCIRVAGTKIRPAGLSLAQSKGVRVDSLQRGKCRAILYRIHPDEEPYAQEMPGTGFYALRYRVVRPGSAEGVPAVGAQ